MTKSEYDTLAKLFRFIDEYSQINDPIVIHIENNEDGYVDVDSRRIEIGSDGYYPARIYRDNCLSLYYEFILNKNNDIEGVRFEEAYDNFDITEIRFKKYGKKFAIKSHHATGPTPKKLAWVQEANDSEEIKSLREQAFDALRFGNKLRYQALSNEIDKLLGIKHEPPPKPEPKPKKKIKWITLTWPTLKNDK